MDFRKTHQQVEQQSLAVDAYGSAIAAAQAVRVQPNLTKDAREAVQWSIVAMLQARRRLTGDARRVQPSRSIPDDVLEAVKHLVGSVYHDEEWDCAMSKERNEHHLFHTIEKIHRWLYPEAYAPPRYADPPAGATDDIFEDEINTRLAAAALEA